MGEGMKSAAKPSSNISEIVSKFAKVCKFRSIGVFTSENLDNNQHELYLNNDNNFPKVVEESSSEEAGCDAIKVDPQSDAKRSGRIDQILKLFDTVSALKVAYVQLQKAHIPYDPDNIRAADGVIVSQLESLCKIKLSYKERQLKDLNSFSATSALLLAEIQVKERLLDKLKSQLKIKESKVVNFRQELHDLELRNRKMAEILNKSVKESSRMLSFASFEATVEAVSKAVHDFSKPLIALMKVSDWDLDKAAEAIERSVVYSKRSHKKYAFEAYIARRMFNEFLPQSCNVDRIMKLDDPIDALIIDTQSAFAQFCREKYLSILHPMMEKSFFGSVDHRTLVSNGMHPQTPFYRAFVKMARCVWILQAAAASVEPRGEIFGVKRGSHFSNMYMESVEEFNKDVVLNLGHEKCRVELMVMPGFLIGNTVIRSRVYLSNMDE
ncbi:protein GRAVITROPIC IN THE LIGHT 1-like [Nicotiana tabacum]|uniref:Protein GRAVITROPIC IN THE LIGHT 1-like n=2 Tax=Nicotiana TaxID=4085 RepID=A0A1S4B2C6_TOBAC|nr:PREDICTED: uncharacterized protein LOC104241004 [Nicotiana sylvestris]XP_016483082.1 PREDICTED: uncharacterized protein LOC107803810 [Nicotiana tabacum]